MMELQKQIALMEKRMSAQMNRVFDANGYYARNAAKRHLARLQMDLAYLKEKKERIDKI